MHLINAILVLMVIRQIREHSLDLRVLAVPVVTVAGRSARFITPSRSHDQARRFGVPLRVL